MVNLTSAAGLVALLHEDNAEIQIYALQSLLQQVDLFWPEISEAVTKIEELYEDELFKQRQLAALLASKIYYHLGEYDESLSFALGAESLFDISKSSEFVDTIIAKGIDKYISLRRQQMDQSQTSAVVIDKRIEQVVEKMFTRCFNDKEYKQAIGIALESFRLDVVENAINQVKDTTEKIKILKWVLTTVLEIVQNLEFRNKVLRLLANFYHTQTEPDYDSVCQCYIHLNDFAACAELLKSLVEKDEFHKLVAYQLAFDLEENATQEFLSKVLGSLPASQIQAVTSTAADSDAMEVDNNETQPLLSESNKNISPQDSAFNKIRKIISGESALESKNSVYHNAITFANAFMNCGTTSDEFLRQNLEWLSRATHWTKFSATAALGVIHKGQIEKGKDLLSPYLPKDGVSGSAYCEGGALFALGLVNANHGAGVVEYLVKSLKDATDETVQAGACLGLGVAGMATDDDDVYESLKNVLFSDSAVAGESAGLAMGLVMLGTASAKAVDEMIQYAHETQHEKIIRGLAVGISMIMYGREVEADVLIEQLSLDKDPVLRYGGIYTVAMAYSGTGSNKAIRRLLHVAVSDVSDDVRRAAVTAIGFVLFRTPKQVPKVVQLLSESYNPHVRYGAALALGISCAGTGFKDALDLLDPMIKDPVDFVRQGALIAMAMILIQHNEVLTPKVKEVRKLYETVIGDKHGEVMAKFGAVLGQGLIDAGGRNVTVSLNSRNGHNSMPSIVGMALFTQYWYWYPLTHFLSLSFQPTGLIGLNGNLEIPKFTCTSNAKPSLFAYPPPTKVKEVEVVEKVATAVLSTTAKAKSRQKKSDKEKGAVDMDVKKAPKKKEESSETLENLARICPLQAQYVTFDKDARYVPVKKGAVEGIILMNDRTPNEPVELISSSQPANAVEATSATSTVTATPASAGTVSAAGNEPAPPAPFEYTED
ncbi:proteasome regulatory particle base subunit [Clydaea vesicula]|uniref:26S proteasome regulatory subunit RPN2 n=1 Tax=Clydaea vesicula TaxID=447962 RepID=A0AAD5U462_9FUNG|nr:proteasome regulatory particle base subunit [Clydaea vesicula]